ncbi:hypothetical protein P4H83_13385 [Paenibacillus favisporus]|jgi:hypothetical protein|nr:MULTISPECIES: hypothetical protein [Paenibacillus]MEC0175859.1 hypothetical protein [Paenibacillus favisporus]
MSRRRIRRRDGYAAAAAARGNCRNRMRRFRPVSIMSDVWF